MSIYYRYLAYRFSSTNNSRRFNGTTFYEVDDPHVQRIHLEDGNQLDGVYLVKFTDDELGSLNAFCKGISDIISGEHFTNNY